jgi:membrane-associated phospholipid phosphatase
MNPRPKIGLLLILSLVIVTIVTIAFQMDKPIRESIVASQGPDWGKSFEKKVHGSIRTWGDWPPLMGFALIGVLLAHWRGNPHWRRILLAAMIASTLAGALANTSRLTTGRTRPRESPKHEQGFYGPWKDGQLLIGKAGFNSFPSGHTATAFGFAAVIILASPAWGVAAIAGACAVAWSSIVIGAHHPSDVVVSIFLSFGVGWFVWRAARQRFMKPRDS